MYKITEDDIRYCDWITSKCCNKWGLDMTDDNKQSGREGMCIAAKKFKPELGNKFLTYAQFYITGRVQRENFSKRTHLNRRNYSCVYRNNLHVNLFHKNDPNSDDNQEKTQEAGKATNEKYREIFKRRNLEDEYIKFEETQDALRSMNKTVQFGVINKAIYGIGYHDTAKKIGMNERSIIVMKEQWVTGSRYARLSKPKQKQYYGEGKIGYEVRN